MLKTTANPSQALTEGRHCVDSFLAFALFIPHSRPVMWVLLASPYTDEETEAGAFGTCHSKWDWVLVEPLIREGNGTPLQYSCLENPMDGGAW